MEEVLPKCRMKRKTQINRTELSKTASRRLGHRKLLNKAALCPLIKLVRSKVKKKKTWTGNRKENKSREDKNGARQVHVLE